jgi:hypothetical protein
MTALMMAADKGLWAIVDGLLHSGADPNEEDKVRSAYFGLAVAFDLTGYDVDEM